MPPIIGETLRVWLLSALVVHGAVAGNPDAKRLYDDLLSNYNKLVRPVVNTSDVLRVCIKLKLSQLIDVSLCNIRVEFLVTMAIGSCDAVARRAPWLRSGMYRDDVKGGGWDTSVGESSLRLCYS
ncbi:hypothetical protein PV325_007948, partial [Microctonus aethiopoides]